MVLRACALEDLAVSATSWSQRRVFLTGHTGFKGGWLSVWLADLGARLTGYSLAPPSTPSLFELARIGELADSVYGDVRDLEGLRAQVLRAEPEVVFHMAAQSLVRPSYAAPVETFATNVMGTVNLLEAVRACPSVRAVVVVTSDKCYEERSGGSPHSEAAPLGGHDPYSASKACAEIVSSSYRRALFPATRSAVATVRAGNVIGGGDWAADRLFPDIMRAFSAGEPVRLRNPASTRPWQHVLEPLAGYLLLAERLLVDGPGFAEAWNFGPSPDDAITVEELVRRVARIWDGEAQWEMDASQQPREAPSLALDASKALRRLGWRPRLDVEATLEWSAAWYRDWYKGGDARALCERQIARYGALPQ